MADGRSMAREDLLCKGQVIDDVRFLAREGQALAVALVELEVALHVGANRYERTPQPTGEHNGTRERAGTRARWVLHCGRCGCVMAATFRACWSAADGRREHWWSWSRSFVVHFNDQRRRTISTQALTMSA